MSEIAGVEREIRLTENYTQVPHGLWTLDVSYGARTLLGWLHSHKPSYLDKLSIRRIRSEFGGGGQVQEWLGELKVAGFVVLTKQGQAHRVILKAKPWDDLIHAERGPRKPTGRKPTTNRTGSTGRKPTANRAGYRPVTAPETDPIEEQVEDQEKSSSEDGVSLTVTQRRQAVAKDVVNAYWEAVEAETGKKPVVEYMGLVKIVEAALRAGWVPADISAAIGELRTQARPVTKTTIESALDGRAKTVGLPACKPTFTKMARNIEERKQTIQTTAVETLIASQKEITT